MNVEVCVPPPVLEEAQSLVGPDADEPLHRESLQGPQGLEDAPHPAGHLSGGVDVVGLGVLGEALLGEAERYGRDRKHTSVSANKHSDLLVNMWSCSHIPLSKTYSQKKYF